MCCDPPYADGMTSNEMPEYRRRDSRASKNLSPLAEQAPQIANQCGVCLKYVPCHSYGIALLAKAGRAPGAFGEIPQVPEISRDARERRHPKHRRRKILGD